MQSPFPYDGHNLPILQSSVSTTRLQRYMGIASGDLAQALRLYMSHLRPLFVNVPSPLLRKDVHKALDEIRLLRNRIAHHESILQRPLPKEHALILTVIRWFCAITADWIEHHSRFNDVYRSRP